MEFNGKTTFEGKEYNTVAFSSLKTSLRNRLAKFADQQDWVFVWQDPFKPTHLKWAISPSTPVDLYRSSYARTWAKVDFSA